MRFRILSGHRFWAPGQERFMRNGLFSASEEGSSDASRSGSITILACEVRHRISSIDGIS